MKKSILAATIATTLSTGLVAQESADFEAFIGGTHYLWDSERSLDDATGLDLGAELPLSENISLDAWLSQVDADVDSSSAELEGQRYSLGGMYYLTDQEGLMDEGIRPFISLGMGHQEFEDDASNDYDETVAYLGAGLKRYFDNNVVLRGDIFGMNSLDNEVTDLGIRLAIGYAFGRTTSKPAAYVEPTPVKTTVQPKEQAKPVVKKVEEKPVVKVAPKPVKPEIDSDNDGVVDSKDKCTDTNKAFKVDATGCPVMLTETVSIKMDVKFPTNSAVVTPDSEGEIKEVADFMQQFEKTVVTVEGYTDDRGSAAYNKSLSQKRADSVRARLIEKFGIAAERVKAIGYGEESPIADNNTAEGRAANRRVVGVIESSFEKPAQK